MSQRFDGHCHVFGIKYLAFEAAAMAFEMMTGRYPKAAHEAKALAAAGIVDFLKWIAALEKALFSDEKTNLDTALNAGKRAWDGAKDVAAIPLMMDIFYLFAPPLNKGERAMDARDQDIGVSRFDENTFAQLRRQLEESGWDAATVAEAVSAVATMARAEGTKAASRYKNTPGFKFHMEALMELKRTRRHDLYPFFAVDPRRPGMIEEVLKGELVGKTQATPFWGIKLYPRLGYHPEARALDALYQWCQNHQIPIVAHCGPGGFPPDPFKSYGQFGEPINYTPVLKKYGGLKIDFAHFGSGNEDWAKQIIALMKWHDGVYADLACYSRHQDVPAFKKAFWSDGRVQSRTLYGTDFDVMYLTSKEWPTMDKYYGFFDEASNPGAFNRQELELLSGRNVKAFLGL